MAESEFMSYRSLRLTRRHLAEMRDVDDYKSFAKSMMASGDARLMRRVARKTNSGHVAAEVVLDLFTMGGIGALTPDISVWLERNDDGSDVLVFSGVVLGGMASDLADGTALRALLEFAHHDDIRINRDRLLETIGRERAARILEMSRDEQLADRLQCWGDTPGARSLWMLRTYANMPVVEQYLRRFAAAGRIEALVSYFFRDHVVDWTMFDAVNPESPHERRLITNLAIENVMRGAHFQDLWRSRTGLRFDAEQRMEIIEEVNAGSRTP